MMPSTNPVFHYVAGVLRAIVPPLVPWVTSVLAGARITQPEDNDVVIVGKIPVSGTYRFECDLSFVLLHHYDNKYWPQGSPVLDRTRHTWKKDVYVGPPVGRQTFCIHRGDYGKRPRSIQPLLPSRRIYQAMESHHFVQAPQWTYDSAYYPSATEAALAQGDPANHSPFR
jgi:hypothetical protein